MRRSILSVLTALVVFSRPLASNIVLTDFQQQALVEHNYFRQLHCTGLLILNSTLNNIAQSYSEYLAANRIFNHSGTVALGENLWAIFSSVIISTVNGSAPVDSWYNESYSYNYSSPGFSPSTGHFTQVIWKNSAQLGIGIALTNDSKSAYVVANYYPAGNVLGAFASNVLPICSTTTTVATTTATATVTTTTVTTIATTTTTTTTTTATSAITTTSTKMVTTMKITTKRRQGREIISSSNKLFA